jgi:hypothetical protein
MSDKGGGKILLWPGGFEPKVKFLSGFEVLSIKLDG